MDYNKTMAVQMALSPVDAPELQLMVEYPREDVIRRYSAQVLGDGRRSEAWLNSEIPSLGFATPESLLQSADQESLRRVLKVLIQIDYGVIG